MGKGLYPTFALLNHRYKADLILFLLFVAYDRYDKLLLIVHVRNKHNPQPQLQQQPFQVLPWRCNGCSSLQEYQGGRRGLTVKEKTYKNQ